MEQNLAKQYELRFAEKKEYRDQVWKILAGSFFQPYISKEAEILDLGSGWGEFINNIEGKNKFGMDLNPDGGRHLDDSVTFLNQDCSAEWPVPEHSLDVVFTSNFLEHLPSKAHVDKTIGQIKRCLKPGGRLICMGPNIKYLPGAYWDFWDHYVALTELSLSEALRLQAFEIEKCVPKFLPYTMEGKKPTPLFLIKWYLALPFAWKVFGKQFLVMARNAS